MEITVDDLLNETKKIATSLKNEENIKYFKKIEANVINNSEITNIFNKMSYLQRKLIKAQYYEKINVCKNTEQELDYWQEKLNNHPLFKEYKMLQKEVNDIMQEIKEIFHTALESELSKKC